MPAVAGDIGPKYDILLQTRDGSTLNCLNAQGQTVAISSMAYMSSIDRSQEVFSEETELQHKDQITQLGSPNLTDREFDQWPQVTQGDWSGGSLQRVLTGATPISGGQESDPTRYWDGDAVLWPISEVVPQRGGLGIAIQDAGGGTMKAILQAGTPAGFVNSAAASCFAYIYETVPAAHVVLVVQSGTTRTALNDPPGIASGLGSPTVPQNPNDFFISAGVLWYTVENVAGGLEIRFVTVGGGVLNVTLFDTIANAGIIGSNNCCVGNVGNRTYLAVPYNLTTTSPTARIRIYDITNGTATSFTEVTVGDTATVLSASETIAITGTAFQGSQLVYAGSFANTNSYLASFDVVANTTTILAQFQNEPQVFFTPTVSGIFAITVDGDMYLVQGNAVQHIGPLSTQVGLNQTSIFWRLFAQPVAYGPYAIFASATRVAGLTTSTVQVYAYDVIRGRFFRINTIGGLSANLPLGFQGLRIGVLRFAVRTVSGVTYRPQWSVIFPTLSVFADPQDVTNVQEFFVGITSTATISPPLVNGVTIISSIIDFTSATTKLYRQILLTWLNPGLPNTNSITVQLDAWLDQDPGSLNASPDFTTGAVGGAGLGGGVVGQTQLALPINKFARKLVYRITTTGGDVVVASALTSAVKLKDIAVQAATGWVQTLELDLSPTMVPNSKRQGSTWLDEQQISNQPQVDGMAAYNFIRQLWRQHGGQCSVKLPNGDSGNWLLQDIKFTGPKPFAVVFRSDQRQDIQAKVNIKLREDL